MALIFIRVHSPLFFCHFSTTIFHMRYSVADNFVISQVFSHEIFRSKSLCHFSTVTFSLWVSRSWSQHQKLCAGRRLVSPQLIFIVSVVDFCSTSHFYIYIYIVCVDRSGSLSGGAFNQLKATINRVLTILFLHKTVLQKVFVTVSLYISLAKSSNIYSRRPHCNIK